MQAPSRRACGILVAAGAGTRLGAGPKAFVRLAGQPLIVHAARALATSALDDLVVVVAPGDESRAAEALQTADVRVTAVCPGGDSRAASVRAGLAATPAHAEVVAVHDAARPLITSSLVDATLAALTEPWSAVAPGLPVVDTLKLVGEPVDALVDDAKAEVVRTVDRRGLWAVQTPQVFLRATLAAAHERVPGAEATDDLALVEAAGGRVRLLPGDRRNFKLTFPEDLRLAEALLRSDAGP